jgi:uncharacterized hydrophobic protein (TIGR00271 family)
MRAILVQVPEGCGRRVVDLADAHDGQNLALWHGQRHDTPVELISFSIANHRLQSFLAHLQELPEARLTFAPQGVFALHPPHDQAPDQVTDVEDLSPVEVLLGGLQSIGSWGGFLGYAIVGGIVAWIGLFTDSVIMLIAAMLIAPFAGPAMNLAVASAHGDLKLLRRTLLRYVVAIAVTILVATALSFLSGQQVATSAMVTVAKVSVVAALTPLAAGAAGALNLVQSSRSSLVSGTATGLLVAAALAPPAALVGMAAAVRLWSMTLTGIFLLLLQLVGIHVAGSLVFRFYGGVTSQTTRYQRGRQWVFPAALAISAVGLAALLFWQYTGSPDLFRATREQRAKAEVQQVISSSGLAHLVESNLRFTQPNISNQNTLLATIYVQKAQDTRVAAREIQRRLTEQIEDRLIANFSLTPLVDVQVMTAPPEASSRRSTQQ